MGQTLDLPVYCSPTALPGLFHHDGERATAAAVDRFGVSSLGTVRLEEIRRKHTNPQVYQFYFHKDCGVNRAMMQRAKEAGGETMMLDGGVTRGKHVLEALSLGVRAVGLGRYYLFPLAAAGQAGVERALRLMKEELIRDMRPMGCTRIDQ